MQRFSKSQTFAKFAEANKPAAMKLISWLSEQYAKLCRDQAKQRQVVAALAAFAALVFFFNAAQLQSQRARLTATTNALVATRSIGAGEMVSATATAAFNLPSSIFAPSAISKLPHPAFAVRDISAGDLITSSNVAARPAVASLVPAGWRIVSISPQTALPPMKPGDHVDVIANNSVLVADAIVVSITAANLPTGDANIGGGTTNGAREITLASHVVIAIPADAAATVATAAALGDATLVVAPKDS